MMEAKIKYIKPEVVSFGYNPEACILAGSGQTDEQDNNPAKGNIRFTDDESNSSWMDE